MNVLLSYIVKKIIEEIEEELANHEDDLKNELLDGMKFLISEVEQWVEDKFKSINGKS